MLHWRILIVASLIYILGVVVGWLAIPVEYSKVSVIAWSIASFIYALLSLYICFRGGILEGLTILLISLFSIGVAFQQRNTARLVDALWAACHPIKPCKLFVFPYEHPRERYRAIDALEDGEVTYQASALVLKVIEPEELRVALHPIEGKSLLLCITGDGKAALKPPIEPNRALVVDGILSPLPRVSNPGQANRVRRFLMNGIVARFKAEAHGITVGEPKLDSSPPVVHSLRARLHLFRMRFKERLFERMRSWLPEKFRDEAMSVIGSMLLGMHAANLPEGIADAARRSGTVHVLVISGLHISFIGMLMVMLTRPLGGFGIALSLLTIACYWLVSQGEPSISRAALMFAYALIGSLFKRVHRVKNYARDWMAALCLSAAFMVAISPASLLNIGFQLSFAATFGILWVGAALVDAIAPVDGERKNQLAVITTRSLLWYSAAAAGAQLMTMPIIVYHFSNIVLAGFISNLFIVPLALPIVALSFLCALFVIAYEAAMSVSFAPFTLMAQSIAIVGKALMWVANELSGWLIWLMGQFANLPYATVGVSEPVAKNAATIIAAYTVLVLAPLVLRAAAAIRDWLMRYRSRVLTAFSLRLALVFALIILLPIASRILWHINPTATLTMLDVGQGQCIFVRAPNGACMLVDAGTVGKDESAGDIIAREVVIPFLYRERVRRIDVLVITHPDTDHVSALPRIVERIPVGVVLDPKLPSDETAYLRTISILAQLGVKHILARRGQTITLDEQHGVYARVLAPSEPLLRGTRDDVNNNVVVLLLNMFGKRVLITSDMMDEQERHLLSISQPGELLSDVLYVPHHGSKTSCTDELLMSVRPQVALISCGRFNPFGHPHLEVIERLRKHGVRTILRTDEDGAIILRANKRAFSIVKFGRRW
ncbi:MAG: DNA internalization-related competence protein ComEC/Rec2 [Armatimonadota bacterium]|nr:DNA internalization-related competence protein ComEC/Rec2 [Armatimonadota bacterium]MCX7777407.1 DNA internalization-related competence protein ComEC/Rec2 [Armatimonadota bacterium]MDW8025076.1 DNA internalization-related competence protein ComEC/Rec2 [Armatimonadota bacterium]